MGVRACPCMSVFVIVCPLLPLYVFFVPVCPFLSAFVRFCLSLHPRKSCVYITAGAWPERAFCLLVICFYMIDKHMLKSICFAPENCTHYTSCDSLAKLYATLYIFY